MSVRIATALTLDGEGFTRVLVEKKAEASAFAAFVNKLGVGIFSGKSAAESAGTFSAVFAAQERLESARKTNAFARLADEEKIAALDAEIASTKARIAAIDGTTVEKLTLELDLESQLLQVERLRAAVAETAAAAETERAAAMGAAVSRSNRNFLAAFTPPEASGAGVRLSTLGKIGKFGLHLAGIAGVAGLIELLFGGEKPDSSSDAARGSGALSRLADLGRSDPQRLGALKKDFAKTLFELKQNNAINFAGLGDEASLGKSVKLSADLKENLLKQAELRKKISDANATRIRAINDLNFQAYDEERKRSYEQLSLEDKLFHQQLREGFARTAMDRATNPLEKAQARLDMEQAVTEQVKLRAEITQKSEKDSADRNEKLLRRGEKIAAALQKVADAQGSYDKAAGAFYDQQADASAFTLADAASGKRGNRAAGFTARGILRDEATARRLRDSGRTVTMFDSATQQNFEAGAEFFQSRANASRGGLEGLGSAERFPQEKAAHELRAAATELKNAAAELKNIELTVET